MKIKQIFIHKLGTVVLTQTSPIIIYAYANLALVALYGNYIMITSSLTSLCSALFSSMDAGVGNLIAQGDKNRIQIVFEELFSIRFYISAVVSFGVLFLSPAFISLWLGQEYLLDNTTLVLMVAIMFISLSRTIIDSFKQGYGLFADVWAPGVEASLNLGLSVLLGYFWGLHGILVGVLISLIAIVLIWKPYYVFSKGFNRSVLSYFVLYGRHLTLLAIASVPSYYLIALINLNESDSWMYFVMVSMVEVGIFAVLLGVLMYLGMSGMRNFIHRLISLT